MLIQSMSGNSFNAEVKLESYLNSTIIWRNCRDLLFAEIFVLLDKYFMVLLTKSSNSCINQRDNVFSLCQNITTTSGSFNFCGDFFFQPKVLLIRFRLI